MNLAIRIDTNLLVVGMEQVMINISPNEWNIIL